MDGSFLVSLNAKALENPLFLEVLKRLNGEAPLVTLTNGKKKPVDPALITRARAWVVAGGDGTLHHALNALMKLPAAQRCPLWYLPFGTGNDFARTVGLSANDPVPLIDAALSDRGSCVSMAAGRCSDRYFHNMATGGLFAEVTVEADPQLKSMVGRWSYFISGIGKILDRRTITVRVNGGAPEKALGFCVGNAKFAGGGIQVTPDASPFDARLEFLLVRDMPAADLVTLGLELQKEEPDLSAYSVRRESVRELHLAFDEPVPINLDGEQVTVTEAAFSVAADAVRIFVPAAQES